MHISKIFSMSVCCRCLNPLSTPPSHDFLAITGKSSRFIPTSVNVRALHYFMAKINFCGKIAKKQFVIK